MNLIPMEYDGGGTLKDTEDVSVTATNTRYDVTFSTNISAGKYVGVDLVYNGALNNLISVDGCIPVLVMSGQNQVRVYICGGNTPAETRTIQVRRYYLE